MTMCPECEASLDLDEDQIGEGEVVSCPDCGADFEIVTAHPLELNPIADEDDEDEDDDDFEDDDDIDEDDDHDEDEDLDEDEDEEEDEE